MIRQAIRFDDEKALQMLHESKKEHAERVPAFDVASRLVRYLKLPGNYLAKSVLSSLADHVDDDFECWPSQGQIASEVGCGVSAVQNALKRLEELGLITSTARGRDGDRGRTSNLIRLRLGGLLGTLWDRGSVRKIRKRDQWLLEVVGVLYDLSVPDRFNSPLVSAGRSSAPSLKVPDMEAPCARHVLSPVRDTGPPLCEPPTKEELFEGGDKKGGGWEGGRLAPTQQQPATSSKEHELNSEEKPSPRTKERCDRDQSVEPEEVKRMCSEAQDRLKSLQRPVPAPRRRARA